MSTTIDERVVSLQFDNKQFENNVQTSMSTLDKLKERLKLKGSAKAAQSEFAAYESGAFKFKDSLLKSFSSLEYEIGNRMKNIIKWLNPKTAVLELVNKEIQSATAGLKEYETQMGAVQTILANTESKGSGIDDVNAALDELNAYADKTIYNFTEMTNNIGRFTAAGVDLDTSVSAIKGIANLAAVSGSTSQQASTAMYQLSQAMSSGTVKLMDWNSVVNAGMGGQVFQDALKETAKVHGIEIDKIIDKQGSFRESLSEGWLTTDILTETLEKFTMSAKEGTEEWDNYINSLKAKGYTEEQAKAILKLGNTATGAATEVKTFTQLFDTLKEAAQSGWAQTWELIIGDFNEAKALLTKISDVIGGVIGKSADARNELLSNWKALGGRDDLVDSLFNLISAISGIIKPIKEAFSEIFPPMTAEKLADFTKGLKNLTEKLLVSKDISDKLKRTFKGLFAIIDIVRKVFKGVFEAIKPLFGSSGLGVLGGGILDITANLGDFLVHLSRCVDYTGIVRDAFGLVVKAITTVIDTIKRVGAYMKNSVSGVDLSNLENFLLKVKEIGSSLKEKFSSIGDLTSNISDGIEKSNIVGILKKVWDFIVKIGAGVVNLLKVLGGGIFDALKNLDFATVIDLLGALATGAVAVSIGKMASSISGITAPLKDLLGVFKGGGGDEDGNDFATQMLMISGSIALLAASLFVLSTLDTDKISEALILITTLFTELLIVLKTADKFQGVDAINSSSKAMFKIAIGLLAMALALKVMATLSWEEIITGLTAATGAMVILLGALKVMSMITSGGIVDSGPKQMRKLATTLIILALALKILATLTWEEIIVGLTAMTATLTVFLIALKVLSKISSENNMATSGAKQILKMTMSLIMIALALKLFATMSWDQITRGLVGMAGALAVMTTVLFVMSKMGNSQMGTKGSAQLLVMAIALVAIAGVIQLLSLFNWDTLIKGVGAMALVLAVLVTSLGVLGMGSGNVLQSAGAILIVAAAMGVLAAVIATFGMMSWEAIAKGLVAIGGALLVIGVAAFILSPVISVITALGTTIALMGVGMLAAGLGIAAFGAGLVSLAGGLTAIAGSLPVVLASLLALITGIITGVIGLIPLIIAEIGAAIVLICKTIVSSVDAICSAVVAVLTAILNAVNQCIPLIVDTVFNILMTVLNALVENAPAIIQAVLDILLACLRGIADNIELVTEAAIDIVVNFVKGIADSIPKVVQAGFDLIIGFLDGLIVAIDKNVPILVEKIKTLFKSILRAAVLVLTGGIVDLKTLGEKIMNSGFVKGIKATFTKVKNAVKDALDKAKTAIKNQISKWKESGKDLINGLVEGVKEKFTAVKEAAVNAVSGAVSAVKNFLGIKSPSRLFMKFGRYMDEGMVIGLDSYAAKVSKAAMSVGKVAANSMTNTISGISDAISSDMDTQPTIRPVLDLTDVRSGVNAIGSMFGSDASIGVMANVNSISSMMNKHGQNGVNADVIAAIDKLRKDLGNVGNTTYQVNGITYDDGSNVSDAIKSLIRATKIERRV